jgi:hypothetical protein
MSLAIHPELETKIRTRAEAEGLTIEAYLERLVRADQQGADELESLSLAGLQSGDPIEPRPSYWQEKHRALDARLSKTHR